jgi:glutamate synthase (NADPH/NADH) small chain
VREVRAVRHGGAVFCGRRRRQSLVVWAINEGRGAARECDRYLMGST